MKLVTYTYQNKMDAGIYHDGKIWPFQSISTELPNSILELVKAGEEKMNLASSFSEQLINGSLSIAHLNEADVKLEAPIPQPSSCRDGYAFRQHVAAARRNRGVPMIPEFDQYPIFYFTNHNAIQGPGEILCMPDHFQKLDFELEVAIVVGKKGRNFTAAEADSYIAGYTIMNDMSARTLQMEEMLLNLGPAKGKDFSTVIGPYFVTPDELQNYLVPAKPNHVGNNHNLSMKCWVNGKLVSEGNVSDMDWTFAEILERCAYGVDVYPGDVIGSGTVGTGCFLELNGTGLLNDKNYPVQWLQDGDVVEMEITGLGRLVNTIKKVDTNFSILALKKQAV
ncbi:MAG: fumarylacetoacetate hydrolase family protein [Bacteroidia bacterium]